MRRFISLKAVAVIAASMMAFAGSVSAYEDEEEYEASPSEEVVIGIIGEVIGGAIQKKQDRDFERKCRRLLERCEDGNENACYRYENRCY